MIARSHGVGEPRWSPSGALVGWLDSWDGRTDLVVGPSDASVPASVISADISVTAIGAYGGGGWCWIDDEHVAVAAVDGRLVVLHADGGGLARVLIADGTAAAPAATRDGSVVACVLETEDRCDVVVVPADGSAPHSVISAADYAWDPAWSPDGRALAWHEWDLAEMSWQSSRIVIAERGALDALTFGAPRSVAGGANIAVSQPRFAPNGSKLAYIAERDGWWNVHVCDADGSNPTTLRAEPNEHCGPSWGPGQRTFGWSPDSMAIAYERNEDGYGRLVVASLDGGDTRDVAKAHHGGIDWNERGIVAARSGAKTPTNIVVTDSRTGARRVLARGPVAGFEACGLVEPVPVVWDGPSGRVHGMLRRPPGVERPPMLVLVHGGPTDQATAEWNPRAAFWASRGWAVLTVNYRGSTGYGRDYREQLNEQWGIADVEDVASGIRHAIDEGWCHGSKVAVTGGSAGGFTALLVCAKHPELVRAGVSLFGVADLAQLAATTHRFESKYLDALVGPLDEVPGRYAERSPVNFASSITVPMLILQGRDDKVVPLAQADGMVAAMRAAGADVEYVVYDGEGHGFRKLANVIDEYERTEAFLSRTVVHA